MSDNLLLVSDPLFSYTHQLHFAMLVNLWYLNKPDLFHRNEKFYVSDDQPSDEVLKIYHKAVKKVVNDIDKFSFNTCISSLMICVNELKSQNCKSKKTSQVFINKRFDICNWTCWDR